jgi:predicted AAA+ superfamily ATPase
VARACAGLIQEDLDSAWQGFSFETYILHELRAYNSYSKKLRNIYYYRFAGGYEIDIVIEVKKNTLSRPAHYVAIELKLAKRWDKRWSEPLEDFKLKHKSVDTYGVYLGDDLYMPGKVTLLNVKTFLESLYEGEIF